MPLVIFIPAYVDNNLLGTGKLTEAAILSLNDTGVWAISAGYQTHVRDAPYFTSYVN